jgi:hypothetical protein
MTPFKRCEARLRALGFVVIKDMERTYAGRVQISNWAPSWTAEIRTEEKGFPHALNGMASMSVLAACPLDHWIFLRNGRRCGTDYELFYDNKPQKPPWWLKAWPVDPTSVRHRLGLSS